jgi:hypothetical protein
VSSVEPNNNFFPNKPVGFKPGVIEMGVKDSNLGLFRAASFNFFLGVRSGVDVVQAGNPHISRLVHQTQSSAEDEGNHLEEVVLAIQGVVCRRKELPPFTSKLR